VTDTHDVDCALQRLIENDVGSVRDLESASDGGPRSRRRIIELLQLIDRIENQIASIRCGI
jgi:hypothetical protein